MTVMSLPPMVPDFEGEISHVVVAGNETLIFIKPSNWQGEWDKIDAKLQDLKSSLQKIISFSEVKSGNFIEFYLATLDLKKRKKRLHFQSLLFLRGFLLESDHDNNYLRKTKVSKCNPRSMG